MTAKTKKQRTAEYVTQMPRTSKRRKPPVLKTTIKAVPWYPFVLLKIHILLHLGSVVQLGILANVRLHVPWHFSNQPYDPHNIGFKAITPSVG